MGKRRKDFESWVDDNRFNLNDIMTQIFKSIDMSTMPKHLAIFSDFEEHFFEELLQYIYKHSSTSMF